VIGPLLADGFLAEFWETVEYFPDPFIIGILILCGAGLPLPEEPILLFAGSRAVDIAEGHSIGAALTRMTLACAFGILLGDLLCFYLGRRLGRGVFKFKFVRSIATRSRRVRAERFFQRYGAWSIFIARFFAGVRLVIYFSAGMSRRISYLRFLLMDFLGVLVSVPISVYIGFVVYREVKDWDLAKSRMGTFSHFLIAGISAGLIIWFILARKKKAADREEDRTGVVKD
jgi:membrane protein DedA with SNARE-associated domain